MHHLPDGVGGGGGVGDVVTLTPWLLLSGDEEGACTLGEGLTGETYAAETVSFEASEILATVICLPLPPIKSWIPPMTSIGPCTTSSAHQMGWAVVWETIS